MNFNLRYTYLQLKRGIRYLPNTLIGITVIALAIGILITASSRWAQDYENQKLTIAVSLPKDGAAEQWMFSILEDMQSIKENCTMLQVDTKTAMDMLDSGDVYGAVIVPQGFVKGIMTGDNIPAEIYLPTSSLEQEMIELLTQAGAKSLAAAQAGIYAMHDFALSNNLKSIVPKLEEDLNRDYIRFILARSNYFSHVNINNTNRLSLQEHYVVSGIALFLFMCLLSVAGLIKKEGRGLYSKLLINGITPAITAAVQTVVLFVMLLIIGMIIWIFVFLILDINKGQLFLIKGALGIVLAVFLTASFGVFIYNAANMPWSAMFFLFILNIAMFFAAGGFLPDYLLPAAVASIGEFLPAHAAMDGISQVYLGGYSGYLLCVIWGVAFLIGSLALANLRYKNANN